MYLVKRTALFVVMLGVFFVPNFAQSQEKFKIGISHVRKALRDGKINEALASLETQAREAEEKALTAEAPESHWRLAAQANVSAGRAARYVGNPQKAITYGEKGFELAQKTGDPTTKILAISSLFHTYNNYNWAGMHGKAARLIDEGFKIIRNEPFRSNPRSFKWEGSLYSMRGRNLYTGQKYREAISQLSKSVSLRETYLAKHLASGKEKRRYTKIERNGIVSTLIYLGRAYFEKGDVEGALVQYQRALHLVNEWRLRSRLQGRLHSDIGKLHFNERRYHEALESFKRGLVLRERRKRSVADVNGRIANVLGKMGKYSEAIVYYEKAVQGVESTRSLLEADYRKPYFDVSLNAYVGIVDAYEQVGKPEEAFNYNERARARSFLDLLGNKVELARSESGLREEEELLNQQIGAIKSKVERKAHRTFIRKEQKQIGRAYKALLTKAREVDKEQVTLMTVEPSTLKEVQEQLDPETTLIEYFVTNSNTFVWVVERDKLQPYRADLPRKKLTELVKSLRQKIGGLEEVEQINEVSSELYAALIQPVLRHVTGKRLVIVPHGVLHYLPFQALISSSGRYLVEDYSIHYLSSASLMKFTTTKRRQGRGNRVLVIGNPDLGASKPGLKYAELEAKEVKSLYPGSKVLLKSEATKETVKEESPKHDILHFAAHAELSKDDPLSSAILLAKAGKEDGRLTVKEIFEMELKADLVVLSGCETALGKISRGDEMVGLTRAFIYAGTPSVVASLWKVEDSSTAALMGSFYKNLKTMSKAEALRKAQLELIRGKVGSQLLAMRGVGGITKSGEASGVKASSPGSVTVPVSSSTSLSQISVPVSSAHPYFWAPFVLVGDGK